MAQSPRSQPAPLLPRKVRVNDTNRDGGSHDDASGVQSALVEEACNGERKGDVPTAHHHHIVSRLRRDGDAEDVGLGDWLGDGADAAKQDQGRHGVACDFSC